jgi:peptidoglycan/LPS O-acetylase OafA/YrhL
MIRRAAANQRDGGSSASGRFRYDPRGLRAVAVLLVVLAHADVSFLRGGNVGVDVFSVFSAF